MADDNIFSGLKVADLSTFIAGPGAAVMLSDFGAEVIKVEPPTGDLWRFGYRVAPQPQAEDNYLWHLNNRNKRGIVLDLKSPDARGVLERLVKWADVMIVNAPRPAREHMRLTYEDVGPWNERLIYADISGFGDHGPDADLPGFDVTAYWARSGLLALTRDAGAAPTLPVAGSGDHASAVGLYSAIVTALYRRDRTGLGSHVTTSLLAEGAWANAVMLQAALSEATFYPLHDRAAPPNPIMNVFRAADQVWFVLITDPPKWPVLAEALDRPGWLADARFKDVPGRAGNSRELTALLDEMFAQAPMAHWAELLGNAHITVGVVRHPRDAVSDPQLEANQIVVPLSDAGGRLTRTVSSPIQVHGLAKRPARRAPELGEHTDEVLHELGFSAPEVERLRMTVMKSQSLPHPS